MVDLEYGQMYFDRIRDQELKKEHRTKLRAEILEASHKGSHRYQRAQNFASGIISLMQDFIPQDRETLSRIHETLMETGYDGNLEIIRVPPEMDSLRRMEIEKAMLEKAMQRVIINTADAAEKGR